MRSSVAADIAEVASDIADVAPEAIAAVLPPTLAAHDEGLAAVTAAAAAGEGGAAMGASTRSLPPVVAVVAADRCSGEEPLMEIRRSQATGFTLPFEEGEAPSGPGAAAPMALILAVTPPCWAAVGEERIEGVGVGERLMAVRVSL